MDYTPKNSTITLKLDELMKNSISPETIAEEVKKAAAEYYAEEKRKSEEAEEREAALKIHREEIAFSLLSWFESVKDIEIPDENYDNIFDSIINRLKELEDVAMIRNERVYIGTPPTFVNTFLDSLFNELNNKRNLND